MIGSLKQLLRKPVKALLFFLLFTACTFLLIFSSSMMIETNQRIKSLEGQFTTLGSVRQPGISRVHRIRHNECLGDIYDNYWTYGDTILVDTLNFEGAEYTVPPENRPTYFAYLPDLRGSHSYSGVGYHVAVFTPLEDCTTFGPVKAEIVDTLYTNSGIMDFGSETLEKGQIVNVCRCGGSQTGNYPTLKAGKQYIASFIAMMCPLHTDNENIYEYNVRTGPFASQYNTSGEKLETNFFSETGRYVEEVDDDFWRDQGHGNQWKTWAEFQEKQNRLFCVKPTSSLQMIPLFQEHRASIMEGREITQDEFNDGAAVCMVSQSLASSNLLSIGDKITLPLQYAYYGCEDSRYIGMSYDLTPFNADGEQYEVFWEEEYEIVGIYRPNNSAAVYANGELPADLFFIPANSVKGSDENNIVHFEPMYRYDTTFQIPNGTIDSFDKALHQAVSEAADLEITYNDNGYSQIIENLNSTRLASFLLFVISLLAIISIIIMLLYFFVVRERKRTAVERSLGYSKAQCRVSLISGIMVLTLLASIIGSGVAAILLNHSGTEEGSLNATHAEETIDADSSTEDFDSSTKLMGYTQFSMEYSAWTEKQLPTETGNDQIVIPVWIYFSIPAALAICVLVLSLILINHNLRIDPIYLLQEKG